MSVVETPDAPGDSGRGKRRWVSVVMTVLQVLLLLTLSTGMTRALSTAEKAQSAGTPVADQLIEMRELVIYVGESSKRLMSAEEPWLEVEIRAAIKATADSLDAKRSVILDGGDLTDVRSTLINKSFGGARNKNYVSRWFFGPDEDLDLQLKELSDASRTLLEQTSKAVPPSRRSELDPYAIAPDRIGKINVAIDEAQEQIRDHEESTVSKARWTATGLVGFTIFAVFFYFVTRSRRQVSRRAEERREWAERRFQALLASTNELVLVVDSEATIKTVGSASFRFVGRNAEDMVHVSLFDIFDHGDEESLARWFRRLQEGKEGLGRAPFSGTLRGFGGELVAVEMNGSDLTRDPVISGVILSLRDVSRERRLEQQSEFLTAKDPLTGSPRRPVLFEQLEALDLLEQFPVLGADGKPVERSLGVLLIRVPTLKILETSNDRDYNEQLLSIIASRVRSCAEPGDVIARTDLDEFAVIAGSLQGQMGVIERARILTQTVTGPIVIAGTVRNVTCRVGVAVRESHMAATELLGQATRAVDHAAIHNMPIVIYTPELPVPVAEGRRIITAGSSR